MEAMLWQKLSAQQKEVLVNLSPFEKVSDWGMAPAPHMSSFSHRVSLRVFAPTLFAEAESEGLTFDSFKYHLLICNKNTGTLTLNLAGNTGVNGVGYVESWRTRIYLQPFDYYFLSEANYLVHVFITSLLAQN